MNGLLLDTNVWLWLQLGEPGKLSLTDLRLIEAHQRAEELYVSATSVLEIARLDSLQRVNLRGSVETFVEAAVYRARLQIIDLSLPILIASTRLPETFHRDPSDRAIVATARERRMTLMTRDRKIIAYSREGHLVVHPV